MKTYVLSGDEKSQKLILQANLSFLELYNRAIFSYMSDPADSPYAEDEKTPRNEFYQRRVDEKRVFEIKKFIRNAIIGQKEGNRVAVIFPTAMLLAASSKDDCSLKVGKESDLSDCLYESENFYIVDGQHRLYSMKSLYDELRNGLFRDDNEEYILEYLKSYKFNCTILLNYDLWEQAQVFADVNFNQKKVSASLYYSIYGMNYSSEPSDWKRNYLYITHQLVNVLNSHPLSPLKGFVKMLGTGGGYISQSFIADNLMRNIKSPRSIWYVDPYDMNKPPIYRYMTIELLTYFSAVSKVFKDYWPKDGVQNSIICKTTGIGALLRLMVYLHQEKISNRVLLSLKELEQTVIYEDYEQEVIKNLHSLDDIKDRLFSLKGKYAGTGGKGLEVKLYYEMRHKIIDPEMVLVKEQSVTINKKQVAVKIYQFKDGGYTYELSHYFQNPDQMDVYHPGDGALGKDMEQLNSRLTAYVNQVQPNAKEVANKNF